MSEQERPTTPEPEENNSQAEQETPFEELYIPTAEEQQMLADVEEAARQYEISLAARIIPRLHAKRMADRYAIFRDEILEVDDDDPEAVAEWNAMLPLIVARIEDPMTDDARELMIELDERYKSPNNEFISFIKERGLKVTIDPEIDEVRVEYPWEKNAKRRKHHKTSR